jgi:hypothetical protein
MPALYLNGRLCNGSGKTKDEYSLVELKKIAKDNGIFVFSGSSKEDICKDIVAYNKTKALPIVIAPKIAQTKVSVAVQPVIVEDEPQIVPRFIKPKTALEKTAEEKAAANAIDAARAAQIKASGNVTRAALAKAAARELEAKAAANVARALQAKAAAANAARALEANAVARALQAKVAANAASATKESEAKAAAREIEAKAAANAAMTLEVKAAANAAKVLNARIVGTKAATRINTGAANSPKLIHVTAKEMPKILKDLELYLNTSRPYLKKPTIEEEFAESFKLTDLRNGKFKLTFNLINRGPIDEDDMIQDISDIVNGNMVTYELDGIYYDVIFEIESAPKYTNGKITMPNNDTVFSAELTPTIFALPSHIPKLIEFYSKYLPYMVNSKFSINTKDVKVIPRINGTIGLVIEAHNGLEDRLNKIMGYIERFSYDFEGYFEDSKIILDGRAYSCGALIVHTREKDRRYLFEFRVILDKDNKKGPYQNIPSNQTVNAKAAANVKVAANNTKHGQKMSSVSVSTEDMPKFIEFYSKYLSYVFKSKFNVDVKVLSRLNGTIGLVSPLDESKTNNIVEKLSTDFEGPYKNTKMLINGKEYSFNGIVFQNNEKDGRYLVEFNVVLTFNSDIEGPYKQIKPQPITKAHPKSKETSNNCVKSSDKKYESRPSPPYPANECRGKVILGNDGDMYISKPTASGVYRWVKNK